MVASDCTVLAAQDVWLPLVPYTRVETCKITISFTGQVKALGFGTVALIGRRPKSVSICTRRETQSISIEPPGNDTKKSTILPAGVSKKNVYSEQPWFDFCSFPHHLKTEVDSDIITPNFFCKQLTVRFSSLAIHFSTRNNMWLSGEKNWTVLQVIKYWRYVSKLTASVLGPVDGFCFIFVVIPIIWKRKNWLLRHPGHQKLMF